MSRMIGHLYSVVIDCPDPDELARFYENLLSLTRQADTGTYVVLQNAAGTRCSPSSGWRTFAHRAGGIPHVRRSSTST